MKVLILTVVIMILSGYNVEAQKIKDNKLYKTLKHPSYDTSYISMFPQKLSLRPFFSNRVYKFKIKDMQWHSTHEIDYKPNVNNRLGLSLRYKGLSVGFSFALPSNEYIYGKTNSINLYLNTQFSFMNWGTDFYYVRNKGFYVANAEDVISGWKPGSHYPTRADLKIINAGISSHMIFSKKFSMKAALYQSEKQLKPAGGFSLGASIHFSNLNTDSSLIPNSQLPYYQDIYQLTSGGFLTIALAPGYSYTYVINDFFVTGMALTGLGLQFQGYRLNAGKIKPGLRFSSYTKFRLAAGYNAEKIFGSIVYSYSSNKIKLKDSYLYFSYQGISINFGMRFF